MSAKRLISISLAALFLLALPAVSNASGTTDLELSPYKDEDFGTKSVALETEYPVYANDIEYISYLIINNTSKSIDYVPKHILEVFRDGAWYTIPYRPPIVYAEYEIVFDTTPGEAYVQAKYNTRSALFDMFRFGDIFDDGRYRIIMNISGKLYSAEFEIGESDISAKTPYGYAPLDEFIKDFSLDKAIEGGVYVEADDLAHNRSNADEFVRKVMLGIPCMLRSVTQTDELIIRDIIYENRRFTIRQASEGGITEKSYSYMSVVKSGGRNRICFGSYSSQAKAPKDSQYEFLTHLGKDSSKLLSEVKAYVRKLEREDTMRAKVFSPDGRHSASLYADQKTAFIIDTNFSTQELEAGNRSINAIVEAEDAEGLLKELAGITWLDNARFELTGTTTAKGRYTAIYDVVDRVFESVTYN